MKTLSEQIQFDSKTPINPTLQRLVALVDARFVPLEQSKSELDEAIQSLTALALSRMNDVFTPLILDAQHRLEEFGANFAATSTTTLTVGLGTHVLFIPEGQREGYVYADFVVLRHTGGTENMICNVVGYDRTLGMLTVNAVTFDGAGSFSAWDIRLGAAPDLTHAERTDNPHETTAAQVGAYTTAQTDTLLATVQGAALQRALNLSDVASQSAARTNLSLGTAALKDIGISTSDGVITKADLITWLQSYVFSTGDVKLTYKNVADSGWVILDDGSLGDALSGATCRANADVFNLFKFFYDMFPSLVLQLANTTTASARAPSALIDFNAHKKLVVPRSLGLTLGIAGTGAGLTARTLGVSIGTETATVGAANLASHKHSINGGVATGIQPGGGAGNLGYAPGVDSEIFLDGDYTGGGVPVSIMQPTQWLNAMVKL